ncbi:MAG: recombinase family protein [Chloroflexi bacterium]|nr:recombinase family protein [Chloroflexota bacterium]
MGDLVPRRAREDWERERIRLRMLRTRTRRVIDGRHAGGRVAYGYRLSIGAVPGLLEIEPVEAEVVRRIFSERARGRSYRQIAEALNVAGVTSPTARVWGESSIRMIATNPIYAGVQRRRTGDGHYIQGTCPPIISTNELIAAMQPNPPVRPGRRRLVSDSM